MASVDERTSEEEENSPLFSSFPFPPFPSFFLSLPPQNKRKTTGQVALAPGPHRLALRPRDQLGQAGHQAQARQEAGRDGVLVPAGQGQRRDGRLPQRVRLDRQGARGPAQRRLRRRRRAARRGGAARQARRLRDGDVRGADEVGARRHRGEVQQRGHERGVPHDGRGVPEAVPVRRGAGGELG